MELNNHRNNCSICGKITDFLVADIHSIKTQHSGTTVSEILKRLLFKKTDLNKEYNEIVQKRTACHECLTKIEKYDLAFVNAIEAENVLISIIKSKMKMDFPDKRLEESEDESDNFVFGNDYDLNDDNSKTKDTEDSDREEVDDTEYIGGCKRCSVNFKSVDELAFHEHFVVQNAKYYECSECLQKFIRCISYRLHLREHLKKREQQFKCQICEKTFSKHLYLDIHQNVHMGKSELECRYCSKVLSTKDMAAKHFRSHMKQYQFQCDRCGKQFIHRNSFQAHQLAHDDIRKVSCPNCHRLFRCRAHLNRHLRTHTGEKPFKCDHCDRTFAQRYNMEQHRRRHYPEEKSFKCSNCQECFYTRRELDWHLKNSHNEEFLRKQRFYARKTRTPVYEEWKEKEG